MKFEIVSKYADADLTLPARKTKGSAGYDFFVAEDTVVQSYFNHIDKLYQRVGINAGPLTLEEMANITKAQGVKPTLVPTGIKCQIPQNMYLELSVRSSCPLKYWLILANGVGIIDSDYYNNSDNEGHIYFQIINLSPWPIVLKKGDCIGQGILKEYHITTDDMVDAIREGGFGSTDNTIVNELFKAHPADEYLGLATQLYDENNCESICAANPDRLAFIVGPEKFCYNNENAKTFTTENCDAVYSGT